MAYEVNYNSSKFDFYGSSLDTKPNDAHLGSTLCEIDTGKLYKFVGNKTQTFDGWLLQGSINSSGVIVEMDYLHNLVHQGDVFFVTHIYRNVPQNGKVYIRHKSGSTVYLHSEITANSTGKWRITSYSGTTFSAEGTIKLPINRKSNSIYAVQSQFWVNPTVSVLGSPRLDLLFGSGTNPSQMSTGIFSERFESLFAPNADVLIEYTNESTKAEDLSVYLNAYETTVV